MRIVTSNKQWREGETPCNRQCKKSSTNFEQCTKCMVVVSQTKSGVALQFEWVGGIFRGDKIYCSIDLIPIFPGSDQQSHKHLLHLNYMAASIRKVP